MNGQWKVTLQCGARIERGGTSSGTGLYQPISARAQYSADGTWNMLGFRVALYL